MKMKIRSNDYEANALAIMELPFVKKMIEENKKLKKKNKALKSLIYSLPEFRQSNKSECSDCECEYENEVEIQNKPIKLEKEHIVYEIQENDDDTTSSPTIVGDLTRCEFSLNSFTDVNLNNENVLEDEENGDSPGEEEEEEDLKKNEIINRIKEEKKIKKEKELIVQVEEVKKRKEALKQEEHISEEEEEEEEEVE